ncbi:hypothetical protein [Flavisphingomonas formosensis]|uniref:hypothetical protein n=1 Tax=Flavisphingomonas formosensis TaxID=861534 RepID=UPI0012FC2B08|nr:hypothetical protein [Sphingomonas formosensis]
MYAYVDRPIDTLCNGSRFLLWAMRGWTNAIENRTCPPVALAPGFSSMGLMLMIQDFHLAMALINKDGLARMVLAPMPHRRITEDEAVLLALWCELTLDRRARVRETLALLVEEDSVALVERAMTDAVAKLKAAGLAPSDPSNGVMKEAKQ